MLDANKKVTRRKFIGSSIRNVSLVGLGGVIGLAASRQLTTSVPETIPSVQKNTPVDTYDANYDLSKFTHIDPALVQYEEMSHIKMRSESLRAIATGPGDHIYVAGDRKIQVFDRNTEPLWEMALDSPARCLVVTGDGTMYMGCKSQVQVYHANGTQSACWDDLGSRAVLTSIAFSENDVFVADAGNRVVLRYDASSKLIRRIGERDDARNIPGFSVPSAYFDVVVAPDGLLRVANPGRHRVEAYTFDGDLEFAWGDTSMYIDGFCGCCNPVNFAMLPDGRFVTCEKGLPRVKVLDATGTLESVVAGTTAFPENSQGCSLGRLSNCQTGGLDVAVDSQGRVLVMDPLAGSVRIFSELA